jgi:hypothetical protein
MSYQLFILRSERIHGFNVLIRHDEDMRWCDGVNIAECGHLIVAVDDLGFSFIRDDSAEMA